MCTKYLNAKIVSIGKIFLSMFTISILLLASQLYAVEKGNARKHIDKNAAPNLLAFFEGDRYGFINQSGVIEIEPQFDLVGYFSEGLAAVMIDGKWGYINKYGKLVIPPVFPDGTPFSEGLAVQWEERPAERELKWFYIDAKGDVAIESNFQRYRYRSGGVSSLAKPFKEGLAAIFVPEKGYGYINKEGKMVVAPMFEEAKSFSEGFAAVKDKKKGRWGFINKEGKLSIEQKYIFADSFSEGRALIRKWVGDDRLYGYIDHSGSIAVEPQFWEAYAFSEGLAAVQLRGDMVAFDGTLNGKPASGSIQLSGSWGFIKKYGEFYISPRFKAATPFSEGLARVYDSNKKLYGYINNTGAFIILPEYKNASTTQRFVNGVAAVAGSSNDGRYVVGYINKKNEYIWKAEGVTWDQAKIFFWFMTNGAIKY